MNNILIFTAVCYVAVLIAVISDLIAGLHRARLDCRPCTSRGLRRTVGKLTSYYSALFALTAVDAMIVGAALGLGGGGTTPWPAFPVLTPLGAVALCTIEVKSIFESVAPEADIVEAARFIKRLLSFWKAI